MPNVPLTTSDVINNGLKAISKFEEFTSKTNSNVVRETLAAIYPLTCSDDTFLEMCKVFLHVAYDLAENTSRNFRIVKYRDSLTVYFDSTDLFEQTPIFTFHYGVVFERPRDSWHNHFIRGAQWAASRTNCRSGRAVGVFAVKNNVPLMNAYNGVPAGFDHPKTCLRVDRGCKTGEGLHLCPCNHAEVNAIGMSSREGIKLEGSTLYSTSRPCPQCMGALSVVKPARIIFDDAYDGADIVDEIAHKAGIELIHIKELM